MQRPVVGRSVPRAIDVPGLGRTTVGKIVAIAKNYEDHRREMAGAMGSGAPGDRAPPEDPVLFLKPATSLVADGGAIELAPGVANVHHELELAAVIGREARRVPAERALAHVAGYGVALDMTARDLQAAAKKAGLPWTLSKSMDGFCPLSAFAPATGIDPQDVELALDVNGVARQRGSTRDMIHPVAAIVAHASRYMTLEPGDVILTGTPAGVAAVKPGDRLDARAGAFARLRVDVR